jgi:pyridoxamine 5'-phosphate oxidase
MLFASVAGLAGSDAGPGTRLGLSGAVRARQNGNMIETLWQPSLVLALYQNRNAPTSRYVQLATARTDGRPSNRTVVFRGFYFDTPALTFATDARTPKAGEMDRFPWAEACWYFPVTHEQYRISGSVRLVRQNTADSLLQKARHDCWRELSEAARLTFTWPRPGMPRDPGVPFPTEHPDPESPLPHFCLVILDPQEVDLLELNGRPQNRWVYIRDEGRWSGVEVNP